MCDKKQQISAQAVKNGHKFAKFEISPNPIRTKIIKYKKRKPSRKQVKIVRNLNKHEIKKRKIKAKIQLIKRDLAFVQKHTHIAKKYAHKNRQNENGAKNLPKDKKRPKYDIMGV